MVEEGGKLMQCHDLWVRDMQVVDSCFTHRTHNCMLSESFGARCARRVCVCALGVLLRHLRQQATALSAQARRRRGDQLAYAGRILI